MPHPQQKLTLTAALTLLIVGQTCATVYGASSTVNGDFHNDNVGLYSGDDGVLSTSGKPYWNPIGPSINDLFTEDYGVSTVDYTLVNLNGFGYAVNPSHLMYHDFQSSGFEFRLSNLMPGEQYDVALYFEGINNYSGAQINVTHDSGTASKTQTNSSGGTLPGLDQQEYLLFTGLEPFNAGVDGYALDIQYAIGAGSLPGLAGFQLRGELEVEENDWGIINLDFETLETTGGGVPTVAGDWNGDHSEIVTGTTLGITPHSGQRMLQFHGTTPTGGSSASNSSEVWQLMDVSHLATEIAAGQVSVDLQYFANRVAGDSQTDTLFQAVVQAHTGSLADFPFNIGSFLDVEFTNFFSDSDVNTWEQVSTTMTLPVGTEYLALKVAANEDVMVDAQLEYDGHFADGVCVQLNVVPEPTTVLLTLSGALLILGRRHRDTISNKKGIQ
jgi:hypothetical protein